MSQARLFNSKLITVIDIFNTLASHYKNSKVKVGTEFAILIRIELNFFNINRIT
jgi:hypothetical protein